MGSLIDEAQIPALIRELTALPKETSHVEFKTTLVEPVKLGQYISALSNSAALAGAEFGYLIFGVHDVDHVIVGTEFRFDGKGKGNEDLIPWLTRAIDPELHFEFTEATVDGKRVVALVVVAASHRPVSFIDTKFIRIESYVQELAKYQDHEKRLWEALHATPFERRVAASRLSAERVLELLDFEAYFALIGLPHTTDDVALEILAHERVVTKEHGGTWGITNQGAVLLARDINSFDSIRRHAVRVVTYNGNTKAAAARETQGIYGYAVGFTRLLEYVEEHLTKDETFEGGIRRDTTRIPAKAVRELIANALVHQDFSVTGSGPLVEIFTDRVEVTNPGSSLVDVKRIIDLPPRSRNESIASLMRRMGICEERGSGWDQIAELVEQQDLPAPIIAVEADSMRVALLSHRPYERLTQAEKMRAIEFHAAWLYTRHEHVTNATVRARFRIPENAKHLVSRILRDAVKAGCIKVFDESVGYKARSYVPAFVEVRAAV